VQSIKDGLLLAKKAINNQAAAKVLQNIQKSYH